MNTTTTKTTPTYLTQKDFVNTGRITTLSDFKKDRANESRKLRHDCLDVILYIGDFYIQMLNDGVFCIEIDDSSFLSKDIKLVESVLWEHFASKKINKK